MKYDESAAQFKEILRCSTKGYQAPLTPGMREKTVWCRGAIGVKVLESPTLFQIGRPNYVSKNRNDPRDGQRSLSQVK